MPQLSTPLKNVSRYLEQEGPSSDESSECEDATSSEPVKRTELPRRFGYQGNKSTTERLGPGEKSGNKRPLSPSDDDDDDGLRITEAGHRQEKTPSPLRNNHSMERSQEKDEDKLIVIDDRDGSESRKGSLLLVKRRKLTHDLVPKKSPVVSLLFTRAGKRLEKTGQSPGTRSKGSSPTMKKSSSSIYSRKPGTNTSPIRGQSPTKTVSLKDVSREDLSKKDLSHNGVSRDNASNTSVSHSNVSREKLSHERCHSPDLVLTNVKKVTSKKSVDNKRENRTTDRQLSFVATRLNRQQLVRVCLTFNKPYFYIDESINVQDESNLVSLTCHPSEQDVPIYFGPVRRNSLSGHFLDIGFFPFLFYLFCTFFIFIFLTTSTLSRSIKTQIRELGQCPAILTLVLANNAYRITHIIY